MSEDSRVEARRVYTGLSILTDNYNDIIAKYNLFAELASQQNTALAKSSLFTFMSGSFFKDIILAITRLFERYERDHIETVHLLSMLKKCQAHLSADRNLRGKTRRKKEEELKALKRNVKGYYHLHKHIFEFRNKLLAHSEFLYTSKAVELRNLIKAADIDEALELARSVIIFLRYYYGVEDNFNPAPMINGARRDIDFLARSLDEEEEFLKHQARALEESNQNNDWWLN